MTKNEFLAKLSEELNKKSVADAADIISEYEQHFAFKMADGFPEEKIAANLGDPVFLAAQFESKVLMPKGGGKKAAVVTGLCFLDLFTGIFYILLIAWNIVMAVLSLGSFILAVFLIGGINANMLIPPMPYWCSAVFGLSIAALGILTAVGYIYYNAFLRQLMRSYRRFHHNTIAAATGKAVLPSLAVHPHLKPEANRIYRSVALVSLAIFAAFAVLGVIMCMISSGALEFWHAWGWFGYTG